MLGIADITQHFIIKKLLKGMSRLGKRIDTRLPITIPLLSNIIQILPSVCISRYESLLFSAAFSLAFFGFLRIGEVALNSQNCSDHVITFDSLKFVDKYSAVELHIASSKTDQEGQGTVISIPAVRVSYCPVKLLRTYVAARPSFQGPLFCHFGGNPMTRCQFSAVLQKACRALQLDTNRYKSHSFRIGAATVGSSKGLSVDELKACGRWSSDSHVYKKYIRIPAEKLIN